MVPDASGEYDVVIIAVRRDQLTSACSALAALAGRPAVGSICAAIWSRTIARLANQIWELCAAQLTYGAARIPARGDLSGTRDRRAAPRFGSPGLISRKLATRGPRPLLGPKDLLSPKARAALRDESVLRPAVSTMACVAVRQ